MTATSASEVYALGVLVDQSTFEMPVEITAAEFEEINKALVALARLEPPFHYRLVERNYPDLQGPVSIRLDHAVAG